MKQHYRAWVLVLIDIVLINLSIIFAYLLRFGGYFHPGYFAIYKNMAITVTGIKIVIFYYLGLYKSLWKYASINELLSIVAATAMGNAAVLAYTYLTQVPNFQEATLPVPRAIYIIAWLLDIMFIGGIRFAYRVVRHWSIKGMWQPAHKKRALIVGAGDAGAMVIREMHNHEELGMYPVAVIDDDDLKYGKKINNVPVVGTRYRIEEIVKRKNIDIIIIAIPSINKNDRREIIEICNRTGVEVKILPGVYEFIEGNISINHLRSVEIEDLLGRDPIELDVKQISGYLKDSVVLVTGGGGSIGSELCRQIAAFKPNKLLILDIYENNAYDIQNELLRKYPNLDLITIIASIRDKERIEDIFNEYKPQIVFHAAAHKHVPLMEHNPMEAIKNNVFGTLNIVQAADKYKVRRFVQISTDKAVNPTNVMGASKRLCEMMIQAYNRYSKTEFVAVRFGNVLGSNGSVIPLFKKQIEKGGPVTVTHPDVIRYFMTIPEAVQLVIQAGGMAKGGEIFVLDMGEPVKIDKLARDLISLSGLEPDEDIKIVYTGLRPGEKLYEELLMEEEGLTETIHDKIHIAKPMDLTMEELNEKLDTLSKACYSTKHEVIKAIKATVPTYNPNNK
ncbi:MAG: polysaccharide biosynthesis protein [Epulopiscium sp.]|jgi:FlaA1/EpsC-like NDP-sugar epimerase|nr:polysaccharide biosynthesis protein [Candidatus Epulonipiscium sp.]